MRPLFAAILFLAALASAQIPLADFSGAVHGVSKKQITIETAEGNLVDFDINKKTRVLRGKKPVPAESLQTGDAVTVEARQEFGQYLIAVTITAQETQKK